ncbi:MAG: hypothetical protein U0Z17_07265 [Bacteroidales bacterium]
MKKLNLLLIFILASVQLVFCQKPFQVNENELIQIMDKFVYMSKLPDHFYSNPYAVKLINEEGYDSYSVAVVSIAYARELPKDSILYIQVQNRDLFIILNNKITLSKSVSDKGKIVTDINRIERIEDSVFYQGAVKYYPFIVIFKVQKECHLFKSRIVKFETYLPINDVHKKYWPVAEPIGAITDETPGWLAKDDLGNLRKDWIAKFKNGKGKFKIKTR